MDPIYKILISGAVILFLCWLVSVATKHTPGYKPGAEKKVFDKMVFWCLFVPVIGTTVGTLVIIWLKSHHLI